MVAQGTSRTASLYTGNQEKIVDCFSVKAGLKLCLPLTCEDTYSLEVPIDKDSCRKSCWQFAGYHSRRRSKGCTCGDPRLKASSTTPSKSNGYSDAWAAPPTNATVAEGTTLNCGRCWQFAGYHSRRRSKGCTCGDPRLKASKRTRSRYNCALQYHSRYRFNYSQQIKRV
jgi:hypothetical protein